MIAWAKGGQWGHWGHWGPREANGAEGTNRAGLGCCRRPRPLGRTAGKDGVGLLEQDPATSPIPCLMGDLLFLCPPDLTPRPPSNGQGLSAVGDLLFLCPAAFAPAPAALAADLIMESSKKNKAKVLREQAAAILEVAAPREPP